MPRGNHNQSGVRGGGGAEAQLPFAPIAAASQIGVQFIKKSVMINFAAPDLTNHPPRSPRVRLGGLVILARMIDKCRATLASKNGEYHYNCPLDRRCLEFLKLSADALRAEVALGKSDGEILEW